MAHRSPDQRAGSASAWALLPVTAWITKSPAPSPPKPCRAPQMLSCLLRGCRRPTQGSAPHWLCSALGQPWLAADLLRKTLASTDLAAAQEGTVVLWSSHLFGSELDEEVIFQGAFKHHSNRALSPGGTLTSPVRSSIPASLLLPEVSCAGSVPDQGLQGREGNVAPPELEGSYCCRLS